MSSGVGFHLSITGHEVKREVVDGKEKVECYEVEYNSMHEAGNGLKAKKRTLVVEEKRQKATTTATPPAGTSEAAATPPAEPSAAADDTTPFRPTGDDVGN